MPDSEKVFKGLLECLKGEGSTECGKCPYLTEKCTVSLREEATELKKEYDELSEEFNSAVELIRKKNDQIKILKADIEALKIAYNELAENGEVVIRCKDCIWFHKPIEELPYKKPCKCNYHGCATEEDKYCWWGEKDD